MDSADEIFCFFDSRLNLQDINKSGLKKWGLKKRSVLGKNILELFPHIKKNKWHNKLKNIIEKGESLIQEKVECPFVGNRRVNVKAFRLEKGLSVILTDLTPSYNIEKKLKNSSSLLRNLSLHLQSLREEEGRRIAREIHDEMAPNLTAFKIDLTWINDRINGYPGAGQTIKKKIRSMADIVDLTIDSVQRICSELRPVLLDDLGLIPAMEWKLQEFQKRTQIKCSLSVGCEDVRINYDRSLCLFRVFQEALTNIARHSQASRVRVSLKSNPQSNFLRLRINDNGKGITKKNINSSKSYGLIGMRERLHALNGKLEIIGKPGKGTIVLAILPLDGGHEEKRSIHI